MKPVALFAKPVLDRAGFWISAACAVHCAVLPFALTVLAVTGFSWLAAPGLEWTILGASLLIGSTRLIYSYWREHRRLDSVALFALGAACAITGRLFGWTPWIEASGMILGGALIAIAHWRNQRLCRCHPDH